MPELFDPAHWDKVLPMLRDAARKNKDALRVANALRVAIHYIDELHAVMRRVAADLDHQDYIARGRHSCEAQAILDLLPRDK